MFIFSYQVVTKNRQFITEVNINFDYFLILFNFIINVLLN